MSRHLRLPACLALLIAALTCAAHPALGQSSRALVRRASNLQNLDILHPQGQVLGKVADVVIDPATGRIRYVALRAGGFLGAGERLFAVPWKLFRLTRHNDVVVLELNIPYSTLRNAPGFDPDHWPNTTAPDWAEKIEAYYGHPSFEGIFVSLSGLDLALRQDEGLDPVTYRLIEGINVLHAQTLVRLDELRAGDRLLLIIEERDGKNVVSAIEVLRYAPR